MGSIQVPCCNEPVGLRVQYPTIQHITGYMTNNALNHTVAQWAAKIKGVGQGQSQYRPQQPVISNIPQVDLPPSAPITASSRMDPSSTYAVPISKDQMRPLSPKIYQTMQKYPSLVSQPQVDNQPIYLLLNSNAYYQGFWQNGLPHGKGRLQYLNGTYLYGQFRNGSMVDCEGYYIYPDGSFYRGTIKNQLANGQGVFVYSNGGLTYEGQWFNNLPHGQGRQSFPDGTVYEGSFNYGVKQGNGILRMPTGYVYSGHFHQGQMEGHGNQTMATGQNYQGEFRTGQREGRGVLQTRQGTYTGYFHRDCKHGEGTFEWHGTNRKFKGHFKDGLQEGFGQLTENGNTIQGTWQKGQNVKIDRIFTHS